MERIWLCTVTPITALWKARPSLACLSAMLPSLFFKPSRPRPLTEFLTFKGLEPDREAREGAALSAAQPPLTLHLDLIYHLLDVRRILCQFLSFMALVRVLDGTLQGEHSVLCLITDILFVQAL